MNQTYRINFSTIATMFIMWMTQANAFQPTNLTDCVMWLQAGAANIQTNAVAGRVSQWNDLSGKGNHAYQSATNRQPLYVEGGFGGHPTIYFDERNFHNDYATGLLTDKQLTNAFSAFIVTRVMDANERGIAWRRILPSRDKNWFLGTDSPGTFYMHGGSGQVSGEPARLNSSYQFNRTYTMAAINNTIEQRFYVNGYDLTGGADKNIPPGRLTIGGAGSTSTDPSDAQVSEVIVYERALSPAEREQVETYLTTRYGVTDQGFHGPVWQGWGTSNKWSDNANWKQPIPADPALAFSANTQTTSINDLLGLNIESVMIWGNSWNFSGNPVTLKNGIHCNPDGSATWALNTALPPGPHPFAVRNAKRLTLSGVISGSGDLIMGYGNDFAGTLAISCPTNTYTGQTLLRSGTAEITALGNAGEPSSFGAATGANATVLIGNRRTSTGDGIRYLGTAAASTDRPFEFIRACSINNASPTGAGLTFNGPWSAAERPGAWIATVSLSGSSDGVNTLNTTLADAPGGANPLYVTVKSGTWAFTQPSTFKGEFRVEGGVALANGTSSDCFGKGPVKILSGGTLGGTGLVSSVGNWIYQYSGATISPGNPSLNNGIGCLTYACGATLDGIRIICQVNNTTNDTIKFNTSLAIPAAMTIQIVADSADTCPETLRILEATSLTGATDLSGWEIEGPCSYRATIDGNAIVLKKLPPSDPGEWGRSMVIRFKGYQGTTTLTNFPALVKLSEGCGNNRFHYADCEADGADLLFTGADGRPLSHEIESWNTDGESHIWVKIPALKRGTEIMAHWNNPSLAPDANLFVPTDLPDCGLWLEAAAGLTTNASGYVSTWSDQSGKGHDASQTDVNKQPRWTAGAVNGHPGVRFEASGAKDGMSTGWSATNVPYTVIVAGTHLGITGYNWRRIVQGSSGYNWAVSTIANGTFFSFVSKPSITSDNYTNIAAPNIRPTPGSPFVASISSDGTQSTFCLNGFAYPSVVANGGPNYLGLGTGGHSGDGWDGDVLEVIAYDRALSSAERQQVERYLALKYDSLSAHRVPSFGLKQWFRGDYINADVLDGTTRRVSKCENQTEISGSMHATQNVTNRMPEKVASSFNGKPALRFDAVAGEYDGLRSPATDIIKRNYSIFAVYSTRATNMGERVVMQGANSISRLSVKDGLVTRQANGVISNLLPCQTDRPVIAAMLCDELSSHFYVNGVNLTQSTAPIAYWGPGGGGENSILCYGAGQFDATQDLPLDGDLAEVLVYNRMLSNTERRRVEAYLSTRYAIPVDTSNSDVWSSEFGGVWHLNDSERLLLADSSTTRNNGVLLGQPDPVTEDALAGKGAVWSLGAQLGKSRTTAAAPQTFSFWSKQSAPAAAQATVLAGTSGQPYAALNNTSSKLQVAGMDVATQTAPSIGEWAQYTVVRNPASQNVQVYSNGEALTTVPDAIAQNLPTGQPLIFGHAADAADSTRTFSGTLDEVRFETVSRSAEWIKATYMTQAENEHFTGYNSYGTIIIVR